MGRTPVKARLFAIAAVTAVALPVSLFGPARSEAASYAGNFALDFDGVNDRVTFGNDSDLRLSVFTIETWFRRDSAGLATNSGGVVAVPLVTKGRSEGDATTTDVNYFLGIDATTGVLVADFEEGAAGATPGRNHPVHGTTFIQHGAWYHAAAAYDGTTWRLYLNGVLDGELTVGQPPRADSIQPVGLATAYQSTNSSDGAFAGLLDETRIWNLARTGEQIAGSMTGPLVSSAGLVARWAMDEGTGAVIKSSAGVEADGDVINGAAWVPGTAFASTAAIAPNAPAPTLPANGATGVSTSPTLQATVGDPNGGSLTTTFYGRPAGAVNAEEFTFAVLPDTQHYTDSSTLAATFSQQTQWLVDNRAKLNLRFVSHLGDITESYNTQEVEWQRADAAMDKLDAAGIPNNVLPGVHDLSTSGNTSTFFDQYFPPSRYDTAANTWYGGWLGEETGWIQRQNKDNYALFTAGGIDFLVLHLEVDTPAYTLVWANDIIDRHPNRQVILVTHAFLDEAGSRATAPVTARVGGLSAADVWSRLVAPNCNIFMVVNGSFHGEARATSNNACGRPVHQVLTNYKEEPNGGNGWLRYYTFRPASNQIAAFTYSPTLNAFATDSSSQFTLPYDMTANAGYQRIGSVQAASGGSASITWSGRAPSTAYEWYAVTTDGRSHSRSATRSFTTGAAVGDTTPPTAGRPVVRPVPGATVGSTVTSWIYWPANDTGGSGIARFRVDQRTNGGAWTRVNSSVTVPRLQRILNTGTATTYQFRVQAIDGAGNVSPWYEGPVLKLPIVQESNTALKYTGTWRTARPTGALGGTTRYATAANATVDYTFRGRGFALVAPKGPTQGSVDVWVDNKLVTTANLYSSRVAPRIVVYSAGWNSWQTHTVRLVVKGTAGHPRVDIDAVVLGG